MLIVTAPTKSFDRMNQIEHDLIKGIMELEGIEDFASTTRLRIREKLEEATRRGLRTTMRWNASNVDGHHYSIITYAINPDLGPTIAKVIIR